MGYLATQSSVQEAETQTGGAAGSEEPTYTEGNQKNYVSDNLIVKLEDGATRTDLEINQQNDATTEKDSHAAA